MSQVHFGGSGPDKNNHFVFEHCPSVDTTIKYKKGLKGIQKVKSFIKKNNIDTLVDLHDDVSTSVSFILSTVSAKQIFGLKKENEKLYTHTVERLNSSAHHIIERTLELTKLFGFNPDYQNAEVDYKIHQKSIDLAESFMNELNGKFNDYIFGCDICQDVCPWNRFSRPHEEPRFKPNPDLLTFDRDDWQELTEEVFQKVFRKSAVKRAKFKGLKRNIAFLKNPPKRES